MIKEFKGISENVAVLKLELRYAKELNIIQVYEPTSAAMEEEDKLFYDLVERTIEEEKGYHTIVMGAWNAKVGLDTPNYKSVGYVG